MRVASSTALKNQCMTLQYGILICAYTPLKTTLQTKRNETEYALKRNETQWHDCQKQQMNGTLITVSLNEMERF